MAIAVIRTGGKQYLVQNGQTLKIEKISGQPGDKVTFETLLTADGTTVEIGKPSLKTKTQAQITNQLRGKKISVIKYKAKTRYKRKVGHRQAATQITVS